MNKWVFAISFLLITPALHAQQADTSGSSPKAESQAAPQAAPQPASQDQSGQNSLPASIRPGHPLDPADVDVLTGKRDREIEAARRASAQAVVGGYAGYGYYGDSFLMSGRTGVGWDMPLLLPLARVANPFFFTRLSPWGFGFGGFGGFRGGR